MVNHPATIPPPIVRTGSWMATRGYPFEQIHKDYCLGNTLKVSNWSRNNPLSGLLTNTFRVFVSRIQK